MRFWVIEVENSDLCINLNLYFFLYLLINGEFDYFNFEKNYLDFNFRKIILDFRNFVFMW